MNRLSIRMALLFVASLALYGCNEEERDITVYGTIFNGAEPQQGATVSVTLKHYGFDEVVGQSISGADGSYEVSYSFNDDGNTADNGTVTAEYTYYQSGLAGGYRTLKNSVNYSNSASSKIKADIDLYGHFAKDPYEK